MTVTIGGLVWRVSSPCSLTSRAFSMACSSLTATSSTSHPNSLARSFAVSASSVELMFTPVMPSERSFIKTSVALRLMRDASVWREMFCSILMTFL